MTYITVIDTETPIDIFLTSEIQIVILFKLYKKKSIRIY